MATSRLSTRRVEWRVQVGTSNKPGQGLVIFEASVSYIPDPLAAGGPRTAIPEPVAAVLDASGYACTPAAGDPSAPGERGVALFTTDSLGEDGGDWTWTARPQLRSVNGVQMAGAVPAFSFTVPTGTGSLDLAEVQKVPASPGLGTEQAVALVARAEKALRDAVGMVGDTLAGAAEEAVGTALADARIVRGTATGGTTVAAGGFIGDNDRMTDLVFDANGEVPDFILLDKWGRRLGTDQAVKGAVTGYTSAAAGGFVGDNDRLTELVFDAQGNVPDSSLQRWAARMNLRPAGLTSTLPIVTVGDSQTGATYDGVTWPEIMRTALGLGPTEVKNCGYPGETSVAIAAKMGAVPAVWPVGGTVPASGYVEVLLKEHTDLMLWWGAMPCTLAGVPGVLSRHPSQPGGSPSLDYPARFTRTAPGAAVKVPPNAPFIPENVMYRGCMTIVMVGRNNTQNTERVLADTRAIVDNLTALDRKYLVLSQINGNASPINAGYAGDYGLRYLDVRSYLQSLQAIADAGLTPTQADRDAIASRAVPPCFLNDAVHMNGAGLTRQGHFVAQHIIGKGWL
ncbi:hypothetical protein [Arthrobacter sp. G119Y2]|uniref:hypothetical protein n=1 Tax=Arthrobacter sp. G119Y2 TaxID=3134965 RepID=UPI00311994F4